MGSRKNNEVNLVMVTSFWLKGKEVGSEGCIKLEKVHSREVDRVKENFRIAKNAFEWATWWLSG